MLPLLFLPFLLCATGISGSFLLNLRLSLIGGRLLIFQSLLRAFIRFGRRYIPRRSRRVRSLRQATRALLLSQVTHAVFQSLAKAVVHLLQIVHRKRTFLADSAI